MTQAEIEKKVDILMKRFDDVNAFFIAKVAQQVAKIGKLIPSTMHYIEIMAEMNEDIAAINQKIAAALRMSIPDLSARKPGSGILRKRSADRRPEP